MSTRVIAAMALLATLYGCGGGGPSETEVGEVIRQIRNGFGYNGPAPVVTDLKCAPLSAPDAYECSYLMDGNGDSGRLIRIGGQWQPYSG